jgi:hypothetical protein
VTLRGGPLASCWGVNAVAGFVDVEDMNAEGAARRGMSAVIGFAGCGLDFGGEGGDCCGGLTSQRQRRC